MSLCLFAVVVVMHIVIFYLSIYIIIGNRASSCRIPAPRQKRSPFKHHCFSWELPELLFWHTLGFTLPTIGTQLPPNALLISHQLRHFDAGNPRSDRQSTIAGGSCPADAPLALAEGEAGGNRRRRPFFEPPPVPLNRFRGSGG